MITLRKSSLWIGGLVVAIVLAALALLLWVQPPAQTPQSAQLTASRAASQTATIAEPDTETSTVTSTPTTTPTATPEEVTPTAGITPSHTPTFTLTPLTEPTIPAEDASPTGLPPMTVIAETQSGPGISKSFDLPPGLYRVSFRAENGFELVLPIVEQGDCGSEPLFYGEPGPFEGSATYRSSDCRLHFEIDGAGGGWSLDVDSIPASTTQSPPLTLEGDAPLTSSVIDLPEGSYRVAVDSQSPALLVTPLVLDGECLERPILVLTAPGSYQTVYESAGCRVVFQIGAATGPWKLVVTVKH